MFLIDVILQKLNFLKLGLCFLTWQWWVNFVFTFNYYFFNQDPDLNLNCETLVMFSSINSIFFFFLEVVKLFAVPKKQ